jgi:putative glycosyltransferase (exosortase G-associated)
LDSVFTLSGAFSAFRKSTILKTQLYNTETVCEDTHVTFQVRKNLKKKVHLCENALFFVDPIDDMNKMYTQRQRWQRGELEVMHMFFAKEMKVAKGFISNFMIRLLIYDHTFAFPRMIWYFALVYLIFLKYPIKLVLGSMGMIYMLYTISAFLFFLNIKSYLKNFKEIRKYYCSKWYICFLMPAYNFIIFWIRFAGIINSINSSSAWKTKTFTQECQIFSGIVKKDFGFISRIVGKLRKVSNHEAEDK